MYKNTYYIFFVYSKYFVALQIVESKAIECCLVAHLIIYKSGYGLRNAVS